MPRIRQPPRSRSRSRSRPMTRRAALEERAMPTSGLMSPGVAKQVRLVEPERYCVATRDDLLRLQPSHMVQVFNRNEFFWVQIMGIGRPSSDPNEWRIVGVVMTRLKNAKPYQMGNIVHFKGKYIWRAHHRSPLNTDFGPDGQYKGIEHR
jgi:hypothetical protein